MASSPHLGVFHKLLDMDRGGGGEGVEIVAALQRRDDPAAGMAVGEIAELLRDDREAGLIGEAAG